MKPPSAEGFWLARFAFLRLIGLIYLVAFLALWLQMDALIGSRGLLPARDFLDQVRAAHGNAGYLWLRLPTLFWLNCSDAALRGGCVLGLGLSFSVAAGLANAPMMLALWLLYGSFVHVGQLFLGYGWEMMVLEAGFLSAFLCPAWDPRPFPAEAPPKEAVWLIRWMLFRVMLGAGLIKLRGDACWQDLTCLQHHFETQPIPNPLSWWLHQAPAFLLKAGVLFNHFVELVAPWFLFWPRPGRLLSAIAQILFQGSLILSGNLSWLNYLTAALAIPCFDDRALARIFPLRLTARIPASELRPSAARRGVLLALAAVVAVLSLNPIANMLSPGQAMNHNFDPFFLVNTYGAFGSVGKRRFEVILQGTRDPIPDEKARWSEYEFPCKPGDPERRPCVVSPYQPRLDWQIWFAAMEDPRQNPWLAHLVSKLLSGDAKSLALLGRNPFPDGPPRFIRAELYEYRFTRRGDGSKAWWERERIGTYLPPLSREHPGLKSFLRENGWPD